MKVRHVVAAITGASGSIYGLRLIHELLNAGCSVSVLISRAGFDVLREEQGLDWSGEAELVSGRLRRHFKADSSQLRHYAENDFLAPCASGSASPDAMVFIPCSMGSLARIASGISGNLLERAADVMIKERKQLLLVPRETPLSTVHLENMLKLSQIGVHIIPAMPGFYGRPQTIDDIVNFVVGKVMNGLGIENSLSAKWGEH